MVERGLDDRVAAQIRVAGGGRPRRTAWSASRTCGAARSASEKTATVSSPILFAVRMTRRAISPRLATRTVVGRSTRRPPGYSGAARTAGCRSRGSPGSRALCGSTTIIRSGVGLKSLHGLFICGQLDTSTSTSVSARTATPAGRRHAVHDAQRAVRLDGHVHIEPVEVGHEVPNPQAMPGGLGEKVLAAAVMEHHVMAVAQAVGLLAAGAADGVLSVDLVGDDGHQRAALTAVQHGPRRT